MKTGLYIGRFQPFHRGHLSVVRQALKEVGKLIIGIGSSQYHGQPQNPLSGRERLEVVQAAISEAGLSDKVSIYLVPDIHDDDKWAQHVKSIVPPFEVVFVGDEGLVKELFKKVHTPVITAERELDISATGIRQKVLDGKEWQADLPPAVATYLEALNFSGRLKQLP